MTRSGKEAGYISFKDDRLYYVLIPILEQKRAMVKIEVSSKQDRHNTMGEKKYKNIDLWVKIGMMQHFLKILIRELKICLTATMKASKSGKKSGHIRIESDVTAFII